jgi:hypothetical protein
VANGPLEENMLRKLKAKRGSAKESASKAKKLSKKTVVVVSPEAKPNAAIAGLSGGERATIETTVANRAKQSLNYLKTKQRAAAAFIDFDGFVCRDDEESEPGKGIEFHLVKLRAALAAELWRRQLFLSVDVIDRLLFDILTTDGEQLLKRFFDVLFDHGVLSPGLVVYPLHSFGVLGLGFFTFFTGNRPEIVIEPAGIAVSAQSNDRDQTTEFLERSARQLGLSRKIDHSDINHYVRSRSLKWFVNNPLLVVAISTLTSGYYENQFIYILKLKLSVALLMMLSVIGDVLEPDERLRQGSSARVNNWQTLDIHHYLVFEPSIRNPKKLVGRCVPMNVARLELAELSDLNADIDPKAWSSKAAARRLEGVRSALAKVEEGYLRHNVLGNRELLKARVYRKILDSLDHFRRSFSAAAKPSDAVVSLAIAFEALLMDRTPSRLTDKLHARVRLALKGADKVKGKKKYRKAVEELYRARSEFVHSGRTGLVPDMRSAQRAYIECFKVIVGRVDRLPKHSGEPMGHLLGES